MRTARYFAPILSVLAAIAFAAPARAQATITGTPAQRVRITRILANDLMPQPDPLKIVVGFCPGQDATWSAGCNYETPFAPAYVEARFLTKYIVLREVGGRFWTDVMTAQDRGDFGWLIHPDGPFPRLAGEDLLAERFEDAYSNCAMGLMPPRSYRADPASDWNDPTGYDPSRATHIKVCSLIVRAGLASTAITWSPKADAALDS